MFHFQEPPTMQQGSFRFPDNCPDADCDFLVTYQASGDNSVVFELRGRGNWAGVGFSDDNQMVSNVDLVDLNNCINIYTERLVEISLHWVFFSNMLKLVYTSFFLYSLIQTYLFAPAILHWVAIIMQKTEQDQLGQIL